MTTKFRSIPSYFKPKASMAGTRRHPMQGVIVRRNSGLLIPAAYSKLAIEANPKAWGAAIVTDGSILTNKGDGLTVELLEETMKSFDKNDITFHFATSSAAINEDDLSPHTIIEKDGAPQLVAFIEGNFPSFVKSGSSHPPEFFIAREYLIPKLHDLYEMTGGDLAKIMEYIKKPHFKNELLANAVDRGFVTFVGATGETLSLAKGDTQSEYSWGWVSHNYGYAIGPGATKEEPKADKPKGMFPSKSTVREKAATPASSAVASAVTPPRTETAVIKNYTKRKESPPKTLSRQEKIKWYKNRIGYRPEGWANGVAIEVYCDTQGKVMTLSQVKDLGLKAAALPKLENPPAVHEKDTEVENIPQPEAQPDAPKPVTDARIPVMSPTAREHIKKMMGDQKLQKIIGDNAAIISDPKKVQELEAKFANFCTQLGIKSMDTFLQWSYPMMYDLCKENPEGASVLMFNFRNMLAYHLTRPKAEEVEANPEVQPQPQPEPAPAAKRPSMFPSKKVA